jgi:precorrin-2 dehydrogenase/sirohydrochlorin ferrochelatase
MTTDASIQTSPKYPLFLELADKPVLVVGAGAVAERKVLTLLHYDAKIRVIAPKVTVRLKELAEQGTLSLEQRPFTAGDCAGAVLVFCATGDTNINQEVYEDAHAQNALVNVVDVPPLCDFYVPSVVDRGLLQIAISTNGASPTVAKQIRHSLEEEFSPEWSAYLQLLAEVRQLVLERIDGEEAQRKPVFEKIATAGILERLVSGEHLDAESLFQEFAASTGSPEELVS